MKKKLYKIAKNKNASILDYKTYRSDMGCQVYNITVLFKDGEERLFDDSYVVGELNAKEDFPEIFETFLLNRHN